MLTQDIIFWQNSTPKSGMNHFCSQKMAKLQHFKEYECFSYFCVLSSKTFSLCLLRCRNLAVFNLQKWFIPIFGVELPENDWY